MKVKEMDIVKIKVARKPIQKEISKVLDLFNKFPLAKKQEIIYDKVFHLFLILYLENGSTFILEKNDIANFKQVKNVEALLKGAEHKDINGLKINVLDFIGNGTKQNPKNFWHYNTITANCQVFVKNLLDGNKLNNNDLNSFVVQDAKKILKNIPSPIKAFANKIVDLSAFGNRLLG